MNYLNGGYVMIKHNATQTELKNAYESKKPVVYYDVYGRAEYARIAKEEDGAYYVYKITDFPKMYKIDVLLSDGGDLPENSIIKLTLTTKDDLLYLNTDDPETAQSNLEFISGYMAQVKIEPQEVGSYTILGGYLDDERHFNILYDDNGAVKFTQLVWDYINRIDIYFE